MIDRSDSVTIDRPIEEVFTYTTDTSNEPEWHTDILEAKKLTAGPTGVGTKWHLRVKPFMGVSETTNEVVGFEMNRKQVLQGVFGPMRTTLTYLFEPADGGTTFTRQVQIESSGWMKLMEPMMRFMASRRNREFAGNLKRVLEQRG
jgi:uncharacterized protein YndB with AHSA1/START domain